MAQNVFLIKNEIGRGNNYEIMKYISMIFISYRPAFSVDLNKFNLKFKIINKKIY